MALVILDRVKETTTTAGAGTITLLGAATGFQAFSAVGNANTTYYCIASQTLNEWEVGVGTYTLSGTTLARTQILASSNSGSVVTFSAGTKDVFVTYPAGYSVSQADTGTAPNQIPLNQYLGTMAFQDANSVNIQGGLVQNATISPANVTAYQLVANSYPSTPPSLMLDFANSKTLDPRITFTRASTATYYDGVTSAVAEQNLLQYSQTFASPWAYVRATVPASTIAAPDGTISGVLFTESSSVGSQFIAPSGGSTVTSGAGTYTYSVYGKNNGRYLTLAGNNGVSNYISVIFDLSTGTYYQYQSGGQVINSVSCTQFGATGWYRCVVTATFTASSGFDIAGSDVTTVPLGGYGLPTYTGGGTAGFYLWGAQLEQRSAVTAYTPTTTAAITNYIPVLQTAASGVARLDNNPTTGESLGLLIEESRVNLTTYSSAFDNAAWTKTASSITTAANIAPDGTQTAQKLVEDTTTAIHYVSDVITSLTAQAYTCIVYAKKAERDFVYLSLAGGPFGSYPAAKFDLTNGITTIVTNVQSVTSSILAVGNGWYRCSMTATGSTTGTTNLQIWIGQSATYNYLGNGYSGISIWGAQVEAGAFATSYIPTVASQVTRAADAASMTGTNFSSWYNVGQGTLYAEAAISNTGTFSGSDLVGITNASGTGMELYKASNNAGMTIYAGTNSAVLTTSVPVGAFNKFALTQTGVISASGVYNGATPVSVTPTLYTPTLLGIGKNAGVANPLCCWTKRITYYPVALTSTQLQALTT